MTDKQVNTTLSPELDLAALRAESASTVAVSMIVGGAVGWWLIVMFFDFQILPFLALFSVFLFGAGAYALRNRRPGIARALLLLGLTSGLALALRFTHNPAMPYFAVLVVVASAGMSPALGLVATALSSILLFLTLTPGPSLYFPLILLWLVTGMEWASTRGLRTAVDWAWSSQLRATALLEKLRNRQGELNRTLAALVEATRRLERTSHELAIARQEAEEAREIKAQFAANVSHELRTPLNLIIGYSELMTRSPEVYGGMSWAPSLRADVREIYNASRHLLGMIDDILDLSRVDAQRLPLRLEGVDLCDLILEATHAVQPLLRGKDVQMNIAPLPDVPELLVDRARIRQVLLNLLNNAIRFTDHGQIEVSAVLQAEEVIVAVTDTGVGIPTEDLEHVFEEFRQARGPRHQWTRWSGPGPCHLSAVRALAWRRDRGGK